MRPLHYLDRVFLAAASVALALQGIDRPRDYWNNHGYIVGLAIGCLLLFGILGPFERLDDRRHAGTRERAWLEGLDALDDGCQKSGLDLRQLAVHVWLVTHTLRHPLFGELRRPISIRIGHHGANRQVTFTRTIGVVGRCWATKNEVTFDALTNFAGVVSEDDWNQRAGADGDGFTWGLTWADYQITKHLSAIVAIPILSSRGRVRGCVSADTLTGTLAALELAMPSLRRYRDELMHLDLARVAK